MSHLYEVEILKMKKYMFEIQELIHACEFGESKEDARTKIIQRLENGEFQFLEPNVSDGEEVVNEN
jgi:hypothetical protein